MRTKEQIETESMTIDEAGLTIRNGKLFPTGNNNEGTRRFISVLRKAADDSEMAAIHSKPTKANSLMQNARAGRREANRLEKLLM